MEIRSDDGARLHLRPTGYQGPPPETPDDDDWLFITADVRTADGRAWSWRDPCLTTQEAVDLARWLHRQGGADVGDRATWHVVEPNLSFRSLVTGGGRIELTAVFSYESLPPWIERPPQTQVHPVPLRVSVAQLLTAAEQWERAVLAYPRRDPG
ncbi:WapI family immunity protein [Micromonospora sp. URMC 105]|uniref:WapI family immunity protein n=1 Tax=Micromonospora sp. URMC 105 TaxID=3423413 RepID=UPI003F1AD344